MKSFTVIIAIAFLFSVSSCKRYVIRSEDMKVPTNNGVFIPSIDAICSNGCRSMLLTIKNISDHDIEIDWNKTMFIQNGSTYGGFMFSGIVYKDRNNIKPNDIVFSKSTFSKEILPCNLVRWESGKYGGWRHDAFNLGENGIYLTVVSGDKVIKEKVSVNLSKELVEQ